MGNEDGVLRDDLENVHAFTHKARNPDVENEVPGNLEFVNPNRWLYRVFKYQDTDQTNIPATAQSCKPVVSDVHQLLD